MPLDQAVSEAFELVTAGPIYRELGKRYRGGGSLYLVGGTHLVFAGFRGQTEDIVYIVRLEGHHQGFIADVRSLIRELHSLETESLRVDELDFRRKFEGFVRLAAEMGLNA